ncbi:MAG: arsenite methyltransferase [Micrococcales bacterium]|nr:arsenite methyltransferase [Micrococcales bacterium]
MDKLRTDSTGETADDIRETVRQRYAQAATQGSCGPAASSCCSSASSVTKQVFGTDLYGATDLGLIPVAASDVSLGCGNPVAVADLNPGERVLDLGSGGGIDVLLAARQVGPDGRVYGVDMTDEMLELARTNAADAGATNVEFRKGTIEALPLDDGCVDVVISNCVVNLSPDKTAVIGEMFRVLRPGGRVRISDVVAEDHLTAAQRAERGDYAGCIAGALSQTEYLDLLTAAGFTDTSVTFTHAVADAMHGATVRAVRPPGRS